MVVRVRSKSQGGNWGEFVFSKELKIEKNSLLSYKINNIFPDIRLGGANRILWIIKGAVVRMGAQLEALIISNQNSRGLMIRTRILGVIQPPTSGWRPSTWFLALLAILDFILPAQAV